MPSTPRPIRPNTATAGVSFRCIPGRFEKPHLPRAAPHDRLARAPSHYTEQHPNPDMAGRPLAQARAQAALEAIRAANSLPTEPRTEPATYSPDLPAEAIALAAIGMHHVEIAAHWAISEQTLAEWEKVHIELQDALQRARTRAKAWWIKQPRVAIGEKDNKFPAGAWSQQVRALFPEYDDKANVQVHIDLGSLVVVRLDGEEPTGSRLATDANPLIEGECIKLEDGLTVEGSAEARVIPAPGSADDPQ